LQRDPSRLRADGERSPSWLASAALYFGRTSPRLPSTSTITRRPQQTPLRCAIRPTAVTAGSRPCLVVWDAGRCGCACLRSIKGAERAASKQVPRGGLPCNPARRSRAGVRCTKSQRKRSSYNSPCIVLRSCFTQVGANSRGTSAPFTKSRSSFLTFIASR